MNNSRAVCINCMDGRVQIPVIQWIKDHEKVDYVDLITEPGVDGIFADEKISVEDITGKVRLSIEKNHAATIFIVGHHDCQANTVDDEEHKQHIQSASARLKKEFPEIPVTGLWVDENYNVNKV